jgi:chromodomain-helicase-DNA-binding protein 1
MPSKTPAKGKKAVGTGKESPASAAHAEPDNDELEVAAPAKPASKGRGAAKKDAAPAAAAKKAAPAKAPAKGKAAKAPALDGDDDDLPDDLDDDLDVDDLEEEASRAAAGDDDFEDDDEDDEDEGDDDDEDDDDEDAPRAKGKAAAAKGKPAAAAAKKPAAPAAKPAGGTTTGEPSAVVPARRLTPEAKARVNEMVKKGVPLGEALKAAAAWETFVAPVRDEPAKLVGKSFEGGSRFRGRSGGGGRSGGDDDAPVGVLDDDEPAVEIDD